MNAVYNEIEPFACDWLERLIERGHVGPGRVERRSITELSAEDVSGSGQRHFFAGIGVWSYALRLAGVPDDASVWTGSCPCQPFSSAGSRGGTSDPRHLWPAWFALIEQCRPAIIFGEQVASPDGLAWLDLVYADLERCGYAVGSAIVSAAGVGAPHRRERIYFVAHADTAGLGELGESELRKDGHAQRRDDTDGRGTARDDGQDVPGVRTEYAIHGLGSLRGSQPPPSVADAVLAGRTEGRTGTRNGPTARRGSSRALANANGNERGSRRGRETMEGRSEPGRTPQQPAGLRDVREPWRDCEWVPCRDPARGTVYRPVEPGTFPLAHGAPARVGRLRGYGNAIVAEVAATFIEAALEARGV